jgi:hypothetical protein
MYQGSWKRLQKEELYCLYSSPNIIQLIKSRIQSWVRHAAYMGERSVAYNSSVGRPEGRRLPGRPRNRWEDIIKVHLKEVG